MPEIAQYTSKYGTRALFQGFASLALREFTYISAITVVNPIVTAKLTELQQGQGGPSAGFSSAGKAWGFLGAFSVGMSAGIISAPIQTINAMSKDERNRGKSVGEI